MSVKATRKRKEFKVQVPVEDLFSSNWLLNFKIKKPFYFNPTHKEFYNCIKHSNTKIAFVDGPAGSMKTYIAIYAGLELIRQESFNKIVYIRSIAESAERSLGSLPGEIDDKFSPYAIPLEEKVIEITDHSTCAILKQKGVIEALPVNFVRGLTFNKSLVVVDEAQNLSRKELTTILTRFGRDTRYIVCGDCNQADVNRSGYKETFNKFNNKKCRDNGIHAYEFGIPEISRSKILRFICAVLGT
jgi:phosphate starvation-inducible PhoH-like protein